MVIIDSPGIGEPEIIDAIVNLKPLPSFMLSTVQTLEEFRQTV